MLLLVFLATMVVSLFHGTKTIALRLQSPAVGPWHWRLSWYPDVLLYPVEE